MAGQLEPGVDVLVGKEANDPDDAVGVFAVAWECTASLVWRSLEG